MKSQPRKNSVTGRSAAVVELAVVLPLVLTLLFGIIEFGWLFMVSHTLACAAREGCRIAALEGSTDSDIQTKVDWYMKSAGIATGDYTTSIQHSTAEDPTETVTVTIPYSKVSLLNSFFQFSDFIMKGSVAMRKEGT